ARAGAGSGAAGRAGFLRTALGAGLHRHCAQPHPGSHAQRRPGSFEVAHARGGRMGALRIAVGTAAQHVERTASARRGRNAVIESEKSQGAIARHWERARRYLAQGQLHAARATFESMRHTDRNDVRTNLLGAEIAWQSGRVREATEYVGLAAIAQTGDPDLACGIMDGLLRAGDCVLARKVLGRTPLANTDSPQLLMRVAGYRQQLGDHPAALESLERIREAGGDTPDSSYYRGQQLIFNGRLQEAEAELESCLQARPEHGRAAQVLARLRRQTPENNHVGRLQEGLGRVTPGTLDHAALEFALYKELEDLERWQEAWSALERGNGVMSRRNRVDVVRFGVFLEQLLARCASSTPRAMREIAGPLPIFVVGLPRSGSTVLERMLGNH